MRWQRYRIGQVDIRDPAVRLQPGDDGTINAVGVMRRGIFRRRLAVFPLARRADLQPGPDSLSR
jgi:hypothetical protein